MHEDCAGQEQVNAIIEKVHMLSERVAVLEQRGELYAPFMWVNGLVTELRASVAAVRESLAVLPIHDAHLAQQIEVLTEQLEALVSRVETLAGVPAGSMQPASPSRWEKLGKMAGAATAIGVLVGGIVTFIYNWAIPICHAIWGVIAGGLSRK